MQAFAKGNLLQLFGTFIKQFLNDMMEYYNVVADFLPGFCRTGSMRSEIVNSGLLGSWLSEVLRDSENMSNYNLRASAIRFVCVLWK